MPTKFFGVKPLLIVTLMLFSVAAFAVDSDGDGDEDILFRNNSTGANVVWIIQNGTANTLNTNAATMGLF